MTYYYTPLEDFVRTLYHGLSIFVPEEIDMFDIAKRLNIHLHFYDDGSTAVYDSGVHHILLDNRISIQEQWQDFGHELCHALRHCGNQLLMSNQFLNYQESKANNFAYHFCIPTFMLEKLEFPSSMYAAIRLISRTFKVEPEFAKKRLERWILQKESFLLYKTIYENSSSYSMQSEGVV